MIEELTPQILMVSVFLIIVIAPILTLLLSALLLWRYRRAVTHAMARTGGFDGPAAQSRNVVSSDSSNPETEDPEIGSSSSDLYRHVILAPWHNAIRYAVSGLAFALVFALSAQFVYPFGLELPGFLVGVWIYMWPLVLALPLIVPGSMRLWVGCVVLYFFVFMLLGLWAATITNIPEYRYGAVILPARSSVTPTNMIRLWFAVNGIPTLLMMLCFNRRVRAVAPLMLALVTTSITGTLCIVFALFTSRGVDLTVAFSVSMELHVFWFVLATYILSLAGFAVIGWFLARWISRAYQRRKLSDQSLMLDALWLLFASAYGMWLAWGGLVWIAVAPAAFLVYKLALAAGARIGDGEPDVARGLTFLRVFSLGRRSEALLEAVAGHWRHIGSIQMITGPDVVGSTVQPHRSLDFLSGKLDRHFVNDQNSLESSMADQIRTADPDGRFRVNNFFCHEDSWQPILSWLVQEGDSVLMDLRSFSANSAGCIHELRYLVQEVPYSRCLLIVDDTTDHGFLQRTLKDAWERLPPGSPNHSHPPDQVTVHSFKPGTAALRQLVRRLCDAACR